jgi:type VI secretion system protein ImpA
MTLDLDSLLAPVSETDPAGPDLAYDPERQEIEQAFDASVSIDASGAEEAQRAVDWRAIVAAIVAQSARTKDVWLPIYLCRAGAQSGSLETVAVGAQYLAGLLETFWDQAHPSLEDYGFQGRKGACDTLASPREFVGPLRRLVLLRHPRFGEFTGEDLDAFRRGGETEELYGPFRAALAEAEPGLLAEVVQQLDAIRNGLRRADEALMRHGDTGNSTNFKPAYETLDTIRAAAVALGGAPAADDTPIEAAADGEVAPATGPAQSGIVRVESREDVVRVLDLAIDYYRRREPASPVPLLLERARAWAPLDFLAVLEDIAPNAMADAQHILKFRRSEN